MSPSNIKNEKDSLSNEKDAAPHSSSMTIMKYCTIFDVLFFIFYFINKYIIK